MKAGDIVALEVSALDARGDGVGELDGRRVVVTGAFPSERVRVRVEAVSRQHPRAFARLLEVERPHPGRRAPPCPRHVARGGACTGCPLMGLSVEAQRDAKADRARGLGLPIEEGLRGGAALGYRASSKRVVGGAPGRVILGSYARGTHDVADMRGCLVDHPRIAEVADAIADAASALGVVPDDGAAGDLRYVWLKTDGERVLATLITRSAESRAPELAARVAHLAAVAWSVQPSSGNAIRGGEARPLTGPRALEVALGDRRTSVGPLGFLQPNPDVAGRAYEALVRDAEGELASGAIALDLYAGAGVTTAMLRERFAEVVPCEAYPESAAALGVPPEEAAPFVARWVGRAVDLVVANPPRTGLGPEVCAALARLAPARLHIMSCDADTLARDLDELASAFVLERVVAFDTLPETPHLELVAHLSARR